MRELSVTSLHRAIVMQAHKWLDLADFVLDYMAPRLVAIVGDDVNTRIQVTQAGRYL